MNTNKAFGLRDKIGYMFGDFGNDFYFVTVGTFLTVFYTDVLGISGAIIGLLFLIARFWDVNCNRFSDILGSFRNLALYSSLLYP